MKLGLFSVGYAGLWGQQSLDLPGFIARAASLGYQSVMLVGKRPHLTPFEHAEERVQQVKAALARHHVECGAVAAYTDFTAPVAAEVPLAEMQFAYVEALCRLAAAVGAPWCGCSPAMRIRRWPKVRRGSALVEALRECVDRAAAHKVTIAVQNHHDLAVHSDALGELVARRRSAGPAAGPGCLVSGAAGRGPV